MVLIVFVHLYGTLTADVTKVGYGVNVLVLVYGIPLNFIAFRYWGNYMFFSLIYLCVGLAALG